jgi:hypothetical protein
MFHIGKQACSCSFIFHIISWASKGNISSKWSFWGFGNKLEVFKDSFFWLAEEHLFCSGSQIKVYEWFLRFTRWKHKCKIWWSITVSFNTKTSSRHFLVFRGQQITLDLYFAYWKLFRIKNLSAEKYILRRQNLPAEPRRTTGYFVEQMVAPGILPKAFLCFKAMKYPLYLCKS